MFDHSEEFTFDIKVRGITIAHVDGTVHMDDDDGYDFIVTAIEFPSLDDDKPAPVLLSENCIDPEAVKLFRELAEQAKESEYLQDSFSEARAEYVYEGAA